MNQAEFIALVKQLEAESERRPRAYKFRVLALGGLAYAYVLGLLAVALGIVAALTWGMATGLLRTHLGFLKGGWILLVFVYAVGRSLWVRLDPPDGILVSRARFSRLFAEIEAVARKLNVRMPHEVRIDGQFNAAMAQTPRLGVLGWPKNTLILGLPYLHGMTAAEARSTIAHELGHMNRGHDNAAAWVYRVRKSWSQLLERMEANEHWSVHLFRPFFRWHAPRFAAFSFVLARMQEYEADQAAVKTVGARTLADKFSRFPIAAESLSAYWHRIWIRSSESATPIGAPFVSMSRETFEVRDAEAAERSIRSELERETGYDDTHPALRDRLTAIGEPARMPPAVLRSAAEDLLGDGVVALARELDEAWKESAQIEWSATFEKAQKTRAEAARDQGRLAELDAKYSQGDLSTKERFAHARLVEDLRDVNEALTLLKQLLTIEPSHAGANLVVGRILLAHDDETGLWHFDEAIKQTEDAILPCWRDRYDFLIRAGRADEAARWLDRARERQERIDAADAERATLRLDGRYELHGFSEEDLAPLRAGLSTCPEVESAWMVRRRFEHFDSERPLWYLFVKRRASFLERSTGKQTLDLALQAKLTSLEFPGDSKILVVNHRARELRKVFETVDGSCIYAG